MANPSKQKGTGGETELLRLLDAHGRRVERTAPTLPYDLRVLGSLPSFDVLATRPDRGSWLMTMRLEDFALLLLASNREAHIEVKRYARFALHSIFEKKFGRKQ